MLLLKAILRTARRSGRPFAVDLVQPDLPLTAEERLWLVRQGDALLCSLSVEGSVDTGEWGCALLELLDRRYFRATGRLEQERCWWQALVTDRSLSDPLRAIARYREYLASHQESGDHGDEARVRLLELLGNVEGQQLPVPRYLEARAATQMAELPYEGPLGARVQKALATLEWRRPEAQQNLT